jgi:hypothetical protein
MILHKQAMPVVQLGMGVAISANDFHMCVRERAYITDSDT